MIHTAARQNNLDLELDRSFDFQRRLPGYNMFFTDSEKLAQITIESLHQGSDHLLKSIGTKSPILNPRRDIASLIQSTQDSLVPGKQLYFIPSEVDGVGLKLVFPPQQNFAKRFVYIHNLE